MYSLQCVCVCVCVFVCVCKVKSVRARAQTADILNMCACVVRVGAHTRSLCCGYFCARPPVRFVSMQERCRVLDFEKVKLTWPLTSLWFL